MFRHVQTFQHPFFWWFLNGSNDVGLWRDISSFDYQWIGGIGKSKPEISTSSWTTGSSLYALIKKKLKTGHRKHTRPSLECLNDQNWLWDHKCGTKTTIENLERRNQSYRVTHGYSVFWETPKSWNFPTELSAPGRLAERSASQSTCCPRLCAQHKPLVHMSWHGKIIQVQQKSPCHACKSEQALDVWPFHCQIPSYWINFNSSGKQQAQNFQVATVDSEMQSCFVTSIC